MLESLAALPQTTKKEGKCGFIAGTTARLPSKESKKVHL